MNEMVRGLLSSNYNNCVQNVSALFCFILLFVCKHLESASDVGQFGGGRSQQVGSIGLRSSRHQEIDSPPTNSPLITYYL